jgi:hypothetical protein
MISAITSFLATIILAISLFHFLYHWKRKQIGKIKIESVQFIRNFVLRAYVKPKSVWILYDKRKNLFRKADFRDVPVKIGLITLIGLILLFIVFLILITITQVIELALIRTTIMIMFAVFGFYDIFIALARLFSLENKGSEKICAYLNKSISLKNFMKRENAFFEITPNFLFVGGFVTSIEFIIPKKYEDKKLEKTLIEIAKRVQRI